MTDSSAASRPSAWLRTREGRLSAALLVIELVAGMQVYMMQTIVPTIAEDLDAREAYGLLTAASGTALFLTLPWGPELIRRFGTSRVLLWLTWGTVLGAAVSAAAPTTGVYVAGRVVAGLSAGAMSSASMGAVVRHLPSQWRRMVLAGYSGMWVASSLVGPSYAAAVSAWIGWRWSMLLYLPFLMAARWLVARNVPADAEERITGARLPWRDSLLLVAGMVMLSGGSRAGAWWVVSALVGTLCVLGALKSLMPAGTLVGRPGRPRSVLVFSLLTAAYLGADAVVAILAHDLLGWSVQLVAVVLSAAGCAWALVGFWCGGHPAHGTVAVRRRVGLGLVLVLCGLLALAAASACPEAPWSTALLLVGWPVGGLGMGLAYLDTMNLIFEEPPGGDGISDLEAAAAVAQAEQVPVAAVSAIVTSGFSALVASGALSWAFIVPVSLGFLVVAALLLARRGLGPAVSGQKCTGSG